MTAAFPGRADATAAGCHCPPTRSAGIHPASSTELFTFQYVKCIQMSSHFIPFHFISSLKESERNEQSHAKATLKLRAVLSGAKGLGSACGSHAGDRSAVGRRDCPGPVLTSFKNKNGVSLPLA